MGFEVFVVPSLQLGPFPFERNVKHMPTCSNNDSCSGISYATLHDRSHCILLARARFWFAGIRLAFRILNCSFCGFHKDPKIPNIFQVAPKVKHRPP